MTNLQMMYSMPWLLQTHKIYKILKKETLLNNLDLIHTRTRNISKENSPIDTGENYEYQLKQMLNSYKTSTTEVILKKR
jgi:hypothetical protein